MSTSHVQIDGIEISSPAEYLRYLDLVDISDNWTRTKADVQNKIKGPQTMKLRGTPSIFALIIGINTYKSTEVHNLEGAVADAHAIKSYLEKILRAPQSYIRMLIDGAATRQNIINSLQDLEKNSHIKWGDPIFIYYSGHGQEVIAPDGWATEKLGSKIQSIVPQDFDLNKGVHVIPDYTLGWLIYRISRVHGDNITVIMDCCHAGSGTRNNEQYYLARTAYLQDYSLPADLDMNLGCEPTRSDGTRSTTPLSGPSLSSHVLLAACSSKEKAHERNGRGQFTRSLENELKVVPPDQVTYVELFDRLENILGQNPQLEGKNKHRILFNAKASAQAYYPHKVRFDTPGRYILNAGAADGVCEDAQFTVYATYNDIFKKPVCIMVPQTIEPFETIVRQISASGSSAPKLGSQAYAVQTHAGKREELKIYMTMTKDLIPVYSSLLRQLKYPGANQYRISLEIDQSLAQLELRRDEDEVTFLILDELVSSHGLKECIFKAPADSQCLGPILQGAAHYYYHLRRSVSNPHIEENVKIEFFKLEKTGEFSRTPERFGLPLRRPTGDNLIRDGAVSLNISENDRNVYGMRITNHWTKDLYPNIFYFDNSELSISTYFADIGVASVENGPDCYNQSAGPSKYDVDSPLLKNGGTLALGFGNGGGTAFEYYIPDGRDVDVGFLKCFFSTSPIDLSKIQQHTPFLDSRAIIKAKVKAQGTWTCVTIPIFQRRAQ